MSENRIAALTGTPNASGNRNIPSVYHMLTNTAPPGVAPQPLPKTVYQMLTEGMGEQAPVAAPLPVPQEAGIFSEFSRGLQSGARRIPMDFAATGALAAKAFGFEESAKDWMDFAMRGNEEIAAELPQAVSFDEAFSSPYNFAKFAARNLGEQAPIMATILLGGGAGGVIGRLVGRGALSAAEGSAAASRFGAAVGAGATGVGMETGSTGQEIYGATGEINPTVAFSAGLAKGALETVVPMAFAKRFGLGDEVAEGLLGRINKTLDEMPLGRRVATGAALGMGVEGATEALQEAIDVAARAYVDENYDALGQEAATRILEAAVTGALVGGVMGGIGGTVGGKPDGTQEDGEELPPGGGANNPDPGDPTRPPPPGGSAGTPGGPKGVNGKPAFVPDETEVIDPPDGTVTPQVAIQYADETSDSPLVEFHNPDEAQFKAAAAGRGFKAWALPAGAEQNLDTTVVTREIPPNFADVVDLSGITNTNTQLNALDKIKQAREKLDEATEMEMSAPLSGLGLNRATQALRDEAEVYYKEAIALGARIKPEPGQSFMLASPMPEGITPIRVSGPMAKAPSNLTTSPQYGASFIAGESSLDNRTDELTVRSAMDTGRTIANPGHGRRFAIDLNKAEANGVTVSSTDVDDWVTEISRNLPDVATFKQEVESAAYYGDLTGIKVKAGMTPQNWQDAFDAYSTLLIEVNLANGRPLIPVQRKYLERVARAGITAKPKLEKDAVFIGPKKKIIGLARQIPGYPQAYKRVPRGAKEFPYGSESRVNQDYRSATNKKDYDKANHAPGTVDIRYGDPDGSPTDLWTFHGIDKVKAAAEKIAALYENLMRTYGLADKRLVLMIGQTHKYPNSGGYYTGNSDSSVHMIMLNADKIMGGVNGGPTETGLGTIVHEFGHFLAIQRFESTDPGLQAKMFRTYQRDMIKASMSRVRDMTDFFNAARMEVYLDQVPLEQSSLWLNSGDPNYLLNFDEWMAEQIAKFFTTRVAGLTRMEKFFKGIAKQMRGIINRVARNFGLTFNELQSHKIINTWMDSMKTPVGQLPSYSPMMNARARQQELQSEENAKTLGMNPGDGTPTGEMVEKMTPMLDKLGIGTKNKKLVQAGVSRMNWLMKWFFTIRQAAQVNPHVKGLRLYNELIDRWALTKAQVQTRADATIKQWRAMSKAQQDSLAKFIFEIDAMTYLKQGEKPRYPTDEEMIELGKKYNMTKPALEVYQRMRQDLLEFLRRMEEIAIRDINATVSNEAIAMVRVAEIKSEFRELRKRPYFPHSRFGDFSIVVKDPKTGKTLYMEQFVSKREAESHAPDIAKMFPGMHWRVDKMPEEVKPFRGLPPFLLAKLGELPGITPEQRIWIENLTAELAPTQSFRKRLTRRLNVPGYSLDAMRSYANYMWHGANYLARVEYQRPLTDAISLVDASANMMVDDQGNPIRGADVTKLRGIADFMRNHMDQVLNPAPDWAQLRSIAFTWWLGFSPVAAFTNLTQNAVTTYPYLGSRFGDIKALNAMRRSLGDMTRITRGKLEALPPGMERAVQRAVEKGITDESFAAELAATAEGGNLAGLLPGNKAHRAFMQFSHYSAWLYQGAEKLNRRVAFNAGWRLAMENPTAPHLQALKTENQLEYEALIGEGFSEIEAMAYLSARDSVWTTQYQYSAAARPRILRGRKGVLLAFMSFVQNSLFFATHDKGRARFMLMMMLIGGLMGLPGSEDINSLVKFIARKLLGKDVDIERETREFVVNLTENPEFADIALNGISRVGFGIPHMLDMAGLPSSEFDVSANVGMGAIIPGLAEIGSASKNYDAAISRTVESMAGAVYGIGLNIMHFLTDDELPWTDGKRYERALPRAVKGAMRAYRYAEEGRERNRQNATLLEFNVEDPDQASEIIMQGLGFTPTRLSRQWDRTRAEVEVTAFWQTRRSLLMRQFDHAAESGDASVVADVAGAIRRFNNEIPSAGYAISNKDLRTSRKERERRRRLTEAGLPQNKADIPVTQSIRRMYPSEHKVIDAEPAPKG